MNSFPPKGRGAADNPENRFESIRMERDEDWNPEEDPAPSTQFLRDGTRSIITYNDSPDLGFGASINPYRGCEHGCIYCYARPTHEYLGFSAGLDFETRIMVKPEAARLLREELASPRWKPQTLAMSGVTDCYQPVERRLRITRGCLEVLAEFRNPVGIVTKNHLVTRDMDLLSRLAQVRAAVVFITLTTLDAALVAQLEPRTSRPEHRLDAIRRLREAGIPVGVMVAPVIPGLTDHEMPRILSAAAEAGASSAAYVTLRLPYGLGTMFEEWLSRHYPDRKEKVLNRLRALRGGRMNDPNFGTRMSGEGIFAEQISRIFDVSCRKTGLNREKIELSTEFFRRPGGSQMDLKL